jgi:hypothetical protein
VAKGSIESTMGSSDLLATASIVIGFGVTAVMFRVQRELSLREAHPTDPSWLAWADYLILGSIGLAALGVVVPLLADSAASASVIATAAACCVAAVILQAGYVPSLLAHYRIELGSGRKGLRVRGEPLERKLALGSVIGALLAFALTLFQRWPR